VAKKKSLSKSNEAENTDLLNHSKPDYDLAAKLKALAFLDASQRELDGVLVPQFLENSRELGIPESTLRFWWKKRMEIYRLSEASLTKLPEAVAVRLAFGMLKILDLMDERIENGHIATRDLIQYFKESASKFRLLTGGSTENFAHLHYIQPIPPVDRGQDVRKEGEKEIEVKPGRDMRDPEGD